MHHSSHYPMTCSRRNYSCTFISNFRNTCISCSHIIMSPVYFFLFPFFTRHDEIKILIPMPQNPRLIPSLPSSINTATVFQSMIQQAQKLFGFIKGRPVVSLRILKILQTESSVEYRSKSCYMYIDCNHNL